MKPYELGKLVKKSIAMSSQIWLGIGRGFRNPAGSVVGILAKLFYIMEHPVPLKLGCKSSQSSCNIYPSKPLLEMHETLPEVDELRDCFEGLPDDPSKIVSNL